MWNKTSAGNRAPQHRQTRRILQTFLQELLDLYALDLAGAVDWSDSGEEPCRAEQRICWLLMYSMGSMEWQCHAEPCRCRVDIRQARPACVPCADRSCSSEKKLSCCRCSWSATLINYIKLEFPNFVALWIQKQTSWQIEIYSSLFYSAAQLAVSINIF